LFEIIKSIYDFPQYYEVTSPGSPGDVAFYLEEVRRSGEPVLEVGFGLGRVGIPIAQSEMAITGIDNSIHMLSVAQERVSNLGSEVQKNISLIFTDIRCPEIKQKYKTVIVPYRAFLHLYNVDEQLAALAAIHDLLTGNGTLILSLFDPDVRTLARFAQEVNGSYRVFRSGKLANDNKGLISWATTHCDLEKQLIEELWTYEEIKESEVVNREYGLFKIRYIFRYEMEHLLIRTGFKIKNLFGDFDRSPYRYGSEQIWICNKV